MLRDSRDREGKPGLDGFLFLDRDLRKRRCVDEIIPSWRWIFTCSFSLSRLYYPKALILTMQSLCASSLASRMLTASRGRGLALLTGMTLLPTTTTTWCEKKTEILSKDSNGNIDWGKTMARIPETAFWDDVARAAGENVSQLYIVSMMELLYNKSKNLLGLLTDCVCLCLGFDRCKAPLIPESRRNFRMDLSWDIVREWRSKRWAEWRLPWRVRGQKCGENLFRLISHG